MTSDFARQPGRRSVLQALGAFTLFGLPDLQAQTGTAAPDAALSRSEQEWRVMSRLGYGPSPAWTKAVQAAPDLRSWALAQIDTAYTASQSAPRIAGDLADFNADLPKIFDGGQRERQARARLKQDAAGKLKDEAAAEVRRMDFSGAPAPEHFSRDMMQKAAAWRLSSASQPELEHPLLARLTEFWFNHLNVYGGKGAVRPFTGHYVVNVARRHALGKFEDLLLASAHHPAMLLYLDQARSVAEGSRGAKGKNEAPRGLNENYARELMELHSLGVDGGYSQADVRELARILTGWTVSPDDDDGFRFAARSHDSGAKRVMGQSFPTGFAARGEREGEDAIRMLARHPSTARRVTTRMAQFFVADTPSPELIQRLSAVFLSAQGDLRAVLRSLLDGPEFWQAQSKLFKTPLDYACSVLAATQVARGNGQAGTIDRRHLVLTMGFLASAGQPLHGWQTPDGYKTDAATWAVPEALTRRADYALAMARQQPDLSFLAPYLSATTRAAIEREDAGLRAGLVLASPDFMYK